MKNISKFKGQKLIDKYRDGSEKLYALCDYINKKAMSWYTLNIKFSAEEVELINKVQLTMEHTITMRNMIAENEETYQDIDRGYEIHHLNCAECNGYVKVIYFVYCQQGFEYNVYKCEKCGVVYEDGLPNTLEQIKLYYENNYKERNEELMSNNIKEEDKISLRIELTESQATDKDITDKFEKLVQDRIDLKNIITADIKLNGELYKNFFKYKYYFNKQ